MKLFVKLLVFVILNELACARKIDECEFVSELYSSHEIPREDLYKHLCIAKELHTANDNSGFLGVYGIGSQWWCKHDKPGGDCNVKCSDLVDDEIADDVQCAKVILKLQGLAAWGISEDTCRNKSHEKAEGCMNQINVMKVLINKTMMERSTEKSFTTISPDTIATTEKAITQPVSSCPIVIKLTIAVLILLACLMAMLWKYNQLMRHLVRSNRNQVNFSRVL